MKKKDQNNPNIYQLKLEFLMQSMTGLGVNNFAISIDVRDKHFFTITKA